MAIFFNTMPLKPALTKALQDAIQAAPTDAATAAKTAAATAETVQGQVAGSIAWGRLGLAALFLIAMFGGCVYTAHDDKLQDLYKAMTHSFQVLLGIVIGLIGGEAAARN